MISGNNTPGRNFTNLFFVLALMSLFAVMALIVVIIGADAYDKVSRDMESNADLRIPLSYAASKVRQCDSKDAVRIIEKDGTSVLVLESSDGQAVYETWIYSYNDFLHEVTIEQGTEFELADGIAILPVYGFEVASMDPGLLKVTASDRSGRRLELLLALRSETDKTNDHKDGAL